MTSSESNHPGRRGFLKGALAVVIGGLATLLPAGVGLGVYLQPWRRRSRSPDPGYVKVTSLAALPADGPPRRFAVVTDRVNVWTRTPSVPVGAVFLRRTGERTVQAFNVVCPHAGCIVDYAAEQQAYLCPCHNSLFGLDGSVSDPGSPSPRGLDALEVEIRHETEVWVRFQNFRVGTRERIVA